MHTLHVWVVQYSSLCQHSEVAIDAQLAAGHLCYLLPLEVVDLTL